MPTLDDTTTLQKNVAIAANDSLVISNKDATGGSLIQQVPAAQIIGGYSHAWLFNFDSASYAVAATSATVDLLTFSSTQRVDKAACVVTTAFNPSGTAVLDLGIDYMEKQEFQSLNLYNNYVFGLILNSSYLLKYRISKQRLQ